MHRDGKIYISDSRVVSELKDFVASKSILRSGLILKVSTV